jgi:signal-transduction protein with cAMP-binding, CBS, and nucleotidyltransferase domain
MVETFTPSQQISPEEMQHRLYCVVHGHALYKNGAGAVVDRHEIGKIFGEVAFVEQKTRQRGKKDGAIFAGNHGMVVVSMSFAHVRALLETNSDLATRFYEYVAKVMYGRLSQSLYMMSDA